jgi:hypothetical protein
VSAIDDGRSVRTQHVRDRFRTAAAGLVMCLALAACPTEPTSQTAGVGPVEPAARPSSAAGHGVETSIFEIEAGDCFTIAGLDEIETVDVVPCDEPHVYEAFAVVEHPAGDDEPYPGEDETLEYSDAACRDEFEGYVGTSYDDSDLVITSVYPSSATWSLGDRAITCALRAEDERELTDSARGSGR